MRSFRLVGIVAGTLLMVVAVCLCYPSDPATAPAVVTAEAASVPVVAEATPGTPPTEPVIAAAQPSEEWKQATVAVTRRFFDLLGAGKKDEAFALFSPASREAMKRYDDWWDPAVRQASAIQEIEGPVLAAPGVLRLRPFIVWKMLTGSGQGKTATGSLDFCFLQEDEKPLIHVLGPDVKLEGLPTCVVENQFFPWWQRVPEADKSWQERRWNTMGLFSPAWPGWDQEPDQRWANVRRWWAEQDKAYGKVVSAPGKLYTLGRWVGGDEKQCLVERELTFEAEAQTRKQVTYRSRLLPADLPSDPQGQTVHYEWRIAEITAGEVKTLPAPPPAAAAAAASCGSSAAASTGGCGSTAAALALQAGVDMHELPRGELQAALRADGVYLEDVPKV